MLKKVLLGVLLVGLTGGLVAGAAIRTSDRLDQVAEAATGGRGQESRTAGDDSQTAGYGRGAQSEEQASNGQGTGNGNSGGNGSGSGIGNGGERQYPAYDGAPEALETVMGSVKQALAAGEDLVLVTADGEELIIGAGPTLSADPNMALAAGEQIEVTGYWEDGEFKATQITRLADGYTVTLRNEFGQPTWAGNNGSNAADTSGDQTGTGQAVVDEWLQIEGTVTAVDENTLTVQTDSGEIIVMENRSWWFAQDQNFAATVGDQLRLTGFYEDGGFEIGQMDNLSTGLTVLIRSETGRPLWAGGGRGSSGSH